MTSQRLQFGQGFWVWWVALILVGVVMQYLLAGALAKEQLGFFGGTAVVASAAGGGADRPSFIPQAHGGALLSGGKPGNAGDSSRMRGLP